MRANFTKETFNFVAFFYLDSLMVMFYVKDKVWKAKDGYEVAGLLKDKIGNEEGFFEFGMLKVEPYSKCVGYKLRYGQHLKAEE